MAENKPELIDATEAEGVALMAIRGQAKGEIKNIIIRSRKLKQAAMKPVYEVTGSIDIVTKPKEPGRIFERPTPARVEHKNFTVQVHAHTAKVIGVFIY